jgi:hypothetical protein
VVLFYPQGGTLLRSLSVMLLLLGSMKNDSTTCMFLCSISDKVTTPLNHGMMCVWLRPMCVPCASA